MNEQDFERAASYWDRKEAASAADQSAGACMPADELRAEVGRFLQEHNTCALATGHGVQIRCTPLEYTYHDGAIWIFSEGGRKFVGLARNSQVSLAVYEPYGGFGKLASVQIDGVAEVLLPGDEEYRQAAAFRHISMDVLQGLSEPMYLIKVVPTRIDYLCSDLKGRGYASRQHLECSPS